MLDVVQSKVEILRLVDACQTQLTAIRAHLDELDINVVKALDLILGVQPSPSKAALADAIEGIRKASASIKAIVGEPRA